MFLAIFFSTALAAERCDAEAFAGYLAKATASLRGPQVRVSKALGGCGSTNEPCILSVDGAGTLKQTTLSTPTGASWAGDSSLPDVVESSDECRSASRASVDGATIVNLLPTTLPPALSAILDVGTVGMEKKQYFRVTSTRKERVAWTPQVRDAASYLCGLGLTPASSLCPGDPQFVMERGVLEIKTEWSKAKAGGADPEIGAATCDQLTAGSTGVFGGSSESAGCSVMRVPYFIVEEIEPRNPLVASRVNLSTDRLRAVAGEVGAEVGSFSLAVQPQVRNPVVTCAAEASADGSKFGVQAGTEAKGPGGLTTTWNVIAKDVPGAAANAALVKCRVVDAWLPNGNHLSPSVFVMATREPVATEPAFDIDVVGGPYSINGATRTVDIPVATLRSQRVPAGSTPFFRTALDGGASSALGLTGRDTNLVGCQPKKEANGRVLWTGCIAPLILDTVRDDGREAYITLEVFFQKANQPVQARNIPVKYPVVDVDGVVVGAAP